ncbi:MAG TPA: glycosyl hydrolase 115 family protein [Puia sp.]|nr:glycosyl hydrolase 115 family protein [Puia sp.]
MKYTTALTLFALFCCSALYSQDLVTEKKEAGVFPVVARIGAGSPATAGTRATAIYVDSSDHWLVQKAAALLQQDIESVTGQRPEILHHLPAAAQNLIIIGSLDQSPLIKEATGLLPEGPSLDPRRRDSMSRLRAGTLKTLTGKWEAFTIQVIDHPLKGIGQALIIAGSDRRGTAYGVFTLSRQMGVSPWYWWADVPVKKKTAVYIKQRTWRQESPAVKYRGFFINDEAPAFSGWTKEKFGGVNHQAYEKVFELLLRLKANYLWPAMWGNAFNDDDTLNPVLADQYGIVMGTSHHEPMLRAQQEWKRYGSGAWNYATNAATLDSFWQTGIQHMQHHESIVTVGMRGDGDMPMEEGSNIALLEKIVSDQRAIIRKVTGQDPSATPQSWALYKEVQDYYDKGMRVPDDITLLLCDDNWGNIRKLPKTGEKPRAGGYGIYYHFDYVGDPRNYKWLNTNPLPRVWEQMHLAWSYGADRIWIVNVGDIKPMEFPTEFFLDYAWDPGKWPVERLPGYTQDWASRQFGPQYTKAIAALLTNYTKYNGRRKPELLSPDTYSLLNYREAETVVSDYNRLAEQADSIDKILPAAYRDAYYQLVLYPIKACANLNELYVTVAKNRLYASQGRAATNELADRVRILFARDSALSRYYNQEMAGGKWNHMMDQTHIGYTGWQQPPVNKIPDTKTIDLPAPSGPGGATESPWGVSIEGSAAWWPQDKAPAVLPALDVNGQRSRYIEVFSRRPAPVDYSAAAGVSWLHITPGQGKTDKQERLWISVDWLKAPAGRQIVPVTITGPEGATVVVDAIVDNRALGQNGKGARFVEANGYLAMEAEHYTDAVTTDSMKWQRIPGLGRTLSGMQASPVTAPAQTPGGKDARLEYTCYLFDTGFVNVQVYCSPTLDFTGSGHLRYGISFDSELPQLIDLATDTTRQTWQQSVADNIRIMASRHRLSTPGLHTLKFWRVDPGLVLQKIVVDAGGVQPSYLGPPESRSR